MVSLSPRLLGFIFWYTRLHALSVEGCGEPDVGVCFLPLQAVHVERIVGSLACWSAAVCSWQELQGRNEEVLWYKPLVGSRAMSRRTLPLSEATAI